MSVTKDETTGETSVCTVCGEAIERALLMKGLVLKRDRRGNPMQFSSGVPTWRRLDRGHASAVCPTAPGHVHVPGTVATGSAFQRRDTP